MQEDRSLQLAVRHIRISGDASREDAASIDSVGTERDNGGGDVGGTIAVNEGLSPIWFPLLSPYMLWRLSLVRFVWAIWCIATNEIDR
jgi:hypothetical protein